MNSRLLLVLAAASLIPAAAFAQAPANPESFALQRTFGSVADFVVRSAEQFPEDKYQSRAVPQIRSFAEEIGHVADSHYFFCARAKGEPPPQSEDAEGKLLDRTRLVARLKESVAYCTGVYGGLTDAALGEGVQVGTGRVVRLAPLVNNAAHDNEHYGKIVMYFRLNGLVPPSSQPSR